MLEEIPRHGPDLAKRLRQVGSEIKRQAEKDLTDFYPFDSDGSVPIAYLWARTVRCEAPNCGAEIPLIHSFWLCKKDKRKWALRYRIVKTQENSPFVEFEVFEPKIDKEVGAGTVTHAKATCVCCGTVLPPERVRMQLVAQSGGADVIFDDDGRRTGGARMTAVVTLKSGQKGRHYRLPTDADYVAVRKAQERLADILREWELGEKQGLCPVPDEPLPLMSGTFNVPLYGINTWGGLFTARQKVTLIRLVQSVQETSGPLQFFLAIVLNRTASGSSSLSTWLASGEEIKNVFARQALPIVWDFGESNCIAEASRTWASAVNSVAKVIESFTWNLTPGQVQQADSTRHPLPDESASVWFHGPTLLFCSAICGSSDYFFVWLKRSAPNYPLLRDPFNPENRLTPKASELCEMAHWDSDRYASKNQQFFEDGMAAAFAEGRRVLHEDGVGSVVFAHKTTEGWEALLSGLTRGGWTITGSWPIATEMGSRLRARNSAALATSIHLVCRPRPDNAPVGDWENVLRELPGRVSDWMERLQYEGIRGADLVFACIGPALEVFSRYKAVETAAGHKVKLSEYLEKVWEVVGHVALRRVLDTTETQTRDGLADVLEEDARLTALFLWTMQSTDTSGNNKQEHEYEDDEEAVDKVAAKGFSLPFDVVRRFTQPMGIDLDIWTDRIIAQKNGVVRLLPVAERAKKLFGEDNIQTAADWIESDVATIFQMKLFPELDAQPSSSNRRRGRKSILDDDTKLQTSNATTLDRVHVAMLLQAGGHANALRTLIGTEQHRGPEFLRLANALSALYPRGSQEKRLLDAMLLAIPR